MNKVALDKILVESSGLFQSVSFRSRSSVTCTFGTSEVAVPLRNLLTEPRENSKSGRNCLLQFVAFSNMTCH